MQRRLPLAVAAVAFVLYVITLNHSATFSGLVNLAKAVGWDWRPSVASPLQVLLTFPVRFLPAGIQLTALNLMAAAFAAGAVGLLARCVALLPQDRTRDQRQKERSEHSLLSVRLAWVPPVLAALVCGLQLSFWENAVVGTGEALDLLIFAWLVHALLSYRLDQKESRLYRFAFVYGLGVTNNYALLGFAPLFLGALVWIRGLAFFAPRFLLRMVGMTLAGTLLYFVLPTVALFGPDPGYTWWDMVRTYWATQRDSLLNFPRVVTLLLSLTSILPVIFMGIRWPAQFGEVSPLGNALTNLMTHLIHLVFLVACTYVAFDQFFSPRNLAGSLAVFLPFYFLGALAVGYCAGYFLLIGGPDPAGTPQWQRSSPVRQLLNKSIIGLILVAVVAVPALLVYQNLPQIWANTGSALSRISALAAQSLPRDGAVVLSDEPFRLYALESEMRRSGIRREQFILIDTRSLEFGGYQLAMQRKHPDVWPKIADPLTAKDRISSLDLVQQVQKLAGQRPVYYLHPSFGYYFEFFELVPRGIVYQLRPVSPTSFSVATLTPAEIDESEKFWREVRTRELDRIIGKIPPAEFPKPGAKLKANPVTLEMYVGRLYSQALNYFGVALQRAGRGSEALAYEELALKLDPYNAAATINAEFNRQSRTGRVEALKLGDDILKRIGLAGGSWESVLASGGPVEEPGVCYAIARTFDAGNNPRQAGQYLERHLAYVPTNLMARVILAGLAVRAGLPDLALAKVTQVRADPSAQLSSGQALELAVSEAWAHAAKNNLGRAAEILRAEQARQPAEAAPWQALFDIYRGIGQLTNALGVAEDQLRVQPRNVQTLVNAAVIRGQMGQLPEAIGYLNRALEVNPKDEFALLNRARFHVAMNNLDLAQKDYENLQSMRSTLPNQVLLGLADVHFRKKNTREAVRLYRQVRKAFPEGHPDRRLAEERLRQLE